MPSSLLRPAGSLGFPNMGQTPPIMAPGQMPTNTGIVPPTAAPVATVAPAPAPAPGQGGHQMWQRPDIGAMPGLLERLQARLGNHAGGSMGHPAMGALLAHFGRPATQPAPAAVAQPAAVAAPAPLAPPVLNRPVDRI